MYWTIINNSLILYITISEYMVLRKRLMIWIRNVSMRRTVAHTTAHTTVEQGLYGGHGVALITSEGDTLQAYCNQVFSSINILP